MTAPRRTEYHALADISPALVNPKRHDLDRIKRSLRRFGFADQAVMDERTGRLVAGHGRIEALRAMHEEDPTAPPDGVMLSVEGGWVVPITRGWASKDDSEAHALGVALNRLTEAGGWDREELADLLESFAVTGIALEDVGSSSSELDDLLASLTPADPTQRAEPRPVPPVERQVQGTREVNLLYMADDYRRWAEALATLRRRWGTDEVPAVVLRALVELAAQEPNDGR